MYGQGGRDYVYLPGTTRTRAHAEWITTIRDRAGKLMRASTPEGREWPGGKSGDRFLQREIGFLLPVRGHDIEKMLTRPYQDGDGVIRIASANILDGMNHLMSLFVRFGIGSRMQEHAGFNTGLLNSRTLVYAIAPRSGSSRVGSISEKHWLTQSTICSCDRKLANS